FAFARRKPTVTDVILLCGLAWQAFVGVRYVVWFGMAAMPIVAQCFTTPRPIFSLNSDAPAPRVSGRERGAGGPANAVVAGLLLLALLALQPWFKPALPLPAEYQSIFANVPGAPQLFSADTPVAATEYLRSQPCQGRLLNEMGAGSYLIWALGPQTQVFIDPRVELFPLELWQDYAALSLQRGQTQALLDKHTIACVLLDTGHQPELAAEIKTLPGWQRTFSEGRSEVWRRTS
ncbi:MAG: hypothetical protein MUD01_25865, partial [Chloroflexaceae bacterium]|nr:hypothetical protein [Chloroflexaceae bacterium]